MPVVFCIELWGFLYRTYHHGVWVPSPCIQSSSNFLWSSKRRVRGECSELFAQGHSVSLRQTKKLNADNLTPIYCRSFISGVNGSQRLKETHDMISYSYSQFRLTQTQAFPWHPFEVVDKRQMCSTESPCLQHDTWAFITVASLLLQVFLCSVLCACLVQRITF